MNLKILFCNLKLVNTHYLLVNKASAKILILTFNIISQHSRENFLESEKFKSTVVLLFINPNTLLLTVKKVIFYWLWIRVSPLFSDNYNFLRFYWSNNEILFSAVNSNLQEVKVFSKFLPHFPWCGCNSREWLQKFNGELEESTMTANCGTVDR